TPAQIDLRRPLPAVLPGANSIWINVAEVVGVPPHAVMQGPRLRRMKGLDEHDTPACSRRA
ncbi:MAG TPA: hypothetical protein VN848_01115, partial [Gemmatimonadales bacterium]|nr:hypothetical protein [Gemmatimonadales bacterium]